MRTGPTDSAVSSVVSRSRTEPVVSPTVCKRKLGGKTSRRHSRQKQKCDSSCCKLGEYGMKTDLEKNPRGATGNAAGSTPVVHASSTSFVILAAIFAAVGGLLF